MNGSGTSGGPLSNAGGSSSNTGLAFTSSTAGTFTITPVATATNHTLGSAATLSGTTSATVTVYSGQGVWNSTGSGNWLDTGKWTNLGGVPGIDGALSASDTATFGQSVTNPVTVNLNGAAPRLAGLQLDTLSNNFTITPGTGGTLTLQGPPTAPFYSEALVYVYGGSNTISAPVILGGDAWIGVDYDATINFSGGISGNHTLTVGVNGISASSIRVDTLQIGGTFASLAAAVPEPSALMLLMLGGTGLLAFARHRWKA